jgi:predicted nucleotidyltransferase
MAVLTSSAALEQFLTEVRRLAPQARLLLFGSQARQQATPDSDYDLLIILPQADPALKEAVAELSAQLLVDEGILISAFVMSEAELERLRFEPFIQNALREGISLP